MHKNSFEIQREINIFQFLFCAYCTEVLDETRVSWLIKYNI